MPELPDITVYVEALEKRIAGAWVERVRIGSRFLLRTVEPPAASVEGKKVVELRRLGKRICIGVEGGIWLVLHLMIAGGLHWHGKDGGDDGKPGGKAGGKAHARSGRNSLKLGGRQNLAAFEFSSGTLLWTEAGSQKRASLHLAEGDEGLLELDPGGLEVLECGFDEFAAVLRAENHTLKRSLTDPRWVSRVWQGYSDAIFLHGKMSPTQLTQTMKE